MTSRILLLIAALGNGAVAATAFALQGWNLEGAHSAARSTARYSVLWFIVGFAAPGLVRLVPALPPQAKLVQSFVAAHMVHFATIIVVLAFAPAYLLRHPIQASATILLGFSAVAATGLMATPRASRLYTGVQAVMLYVIFLIFFLAFAKHPIRPLRVYAVLLGLALILRLTSGLTFWQARIKTAA